jgi:hypothetical protein
MNISTTESPSSWYAGRAITQMIMKILITTIFLSLSVTLFAQDKVVGHYRDYFGNRIQLYSDNTFNYTWHFDLSASWTKGTWKLKGDTVYFHMVPFYDTLSQTNSSGVTTDTLILSTDKVPERFSQVESATMLLSSGGQNRMSYPDKLVYKRGRLYKVQNGKLITKKQRWLGVGKKRNPWYFKSKD